MPSAVDTGPRHCVAVPMFLAVLALISCIFAVVLTFSWVHLGESSCGVLYRPSSWGDSAFCSELMRNRALAVAALAVMAILSLYAAVLKTKRPRGDQTAS
jgi:hypothetical protein